MNPWLRGLWDTIHFQHRCVSGRLWQKVRKGKREDGGRGVFGGECIVWMYVLMFDPTERCTGTKMPLARRVTSATLWSFFFFPPRHPFCFRWWWQLSLLVTSKEPRIIGFIAMVRRCPPTRRVERKLPMRKASTQMCNAHACMPAHKQMCLITSTALPQSNSSEGWWIPKKAQKLQTNVYFAIIISAWMARCHVVRYLEFKLKSGSNLIMIGSKF